MNPMYRRAAAALGLAGVLLAAGSVAAQTVNVPQPSAGLMPNAAAGKARFEQHCAVCHGGQLDGSDKGPPLLHKIYEPSHHGDASFQMAVRHGTRAHHWNFGDMAPVPGISPDDVAHITAYVRMRQRQVGIR